MKVGITYDLKNDYLALGYSCEEAAEFDSEETINAIEKTLVSIGYETDRIGNIDNLIRRLCSGDRWDVVFNIAEGLRGMGREAQVPALLDAFNIPYTFSGPVILALTLDKALTKRIVRDMGIPTAEFTVITEEKDLFDVKLPFPIFAKPVGEGTSKGITGSSLIYSREELFRACSELLDKFSQPVLLEKYLPGREFTAGIIGSGRDARVLGIVEVLLNDHAEQHAYSYFNKANFQEMITYRLVEDGVASSAASTALEIWRGLGCLDCGRVDLRCDEKGIPNFLEVNPLAGLSPGVSDLPIMCSLKGIEYRELIGMIMESALGRLRGIKIPEAPYLHPGTGKDTVAPVLSA